MPSAMERLTDEAESTRRNGTVLCQDGAIGKIDRRGVVGCGAPVQEFPRLAIGVNRPAAEHTGIEEKKPAFARPADLGVEIGDEHRLAHGEWRSAADLPQL